MTYSIRERNGKVYSATRNQKQFEDIGCDVDRNALLEKNDNSSEENTSDETVNSRPPVSNTSLSKRKEGTTFETNCDIDYSITKEGLWRCIDDGFNKRKMSDEQVFEKIKRYYGIEMVYTVENKLFKVIDVSFKRENLDEKFKMNMTEKIKEFKNSGYESSKHFYHITQYTIWEINGKYSKRQQKIDEILLEQMQDVNFEKEGTVKNTQKNIW